MTQPDTSDISHVSVLLDETVQALVSSATTLDNKVFVDGTLGGAGHSARLAQCLPASATLIGIDRDPIALEKAQARLAGVTCQTQLIRSSFGQLASHVSPGQITGGLMLDLGFSAFQMMVHDRGFSFMRPGPLDMRMDPSLPLTAADIVNTWSAEDLANLFWTAADESLSRPIARVLEARRQTQPFTRTDELADVVKSVIQRKRKSSKDRIHPATKVFMALRMAVNNELGELQACLDAMPVLLAPQARVAIITFHSKEDQLVKQAFKRYCATCICPPRYPVCQCEHQATFKKVKGSPFEPGEAEVETNPQARSAKLYVYERL